MLLLKFWMQSLCLRLLGVDLQLYECLVVTWIFQSVNIHLWQQLIRFWCTEILGNCKNLAISKLLHLSHIILRFRNNLRDNQPQYPVISTLIWRVHGHLMTKSSIYIFCIHYKTVNKVWYKKYISKSTHLITNLPQHFLQNLKIFFTIQIQMLNWWNRMSM